MQTVTLPKIEFDFMERELNEFRQDAEAKAEVIVQERYHLLTNEIKELKSTEAQIWRVPVITYKRPYGKFSYDTEYHMDNFKATEMVYTYNREFLYKLLDKVKEAENQFELGQQDSTEYHQILIENLQDKCDQLRTVATTNNNAATIYGCGWFVTGVLGVLSHVFF